MLHTDSAVIAEGKYDKIRLSAVIDALIVTTDGFGIFKNCEKREYIRRLAREKGIIIITDSDAAGFKIRAFLKSIAPDCNVAHAYIPDVYGKEKRKDNFSKEGKIGVEGMDTKTLYEALLKTGLFSENENTKNPRRLISNADLYEAGLSGTPLCSERRRRLLAELSLPQRLCGNGFLQALNAFISYDDFIKITAEIFHG